MEIVLKELLSIRMTPENARFNRDSGYELPDCWIATYKKLRGGASLSSTHTHTNRQTDKLTTVTLANANQNSGYELLDCHIQETGRWGQLEQCPRDPCQARGGVVRHAR